MYIWYGTYFATTPSILTLSAVMTAWKFSVVMLPVDVVTAEFAVSV